MIIRKIQNSLILVCCHHVSSLTLTGISLENIQEWETTTKGLEDASRRNDTALRSYTSSVASGAITSSNKFYANLDNVSESTIKSAMTDISSEVTTSSTISDISGYFTSNSRY